MNLKLIPYLIARGLSVIYRPFILFLISTISIPSSNIIGLVFVNTTLSMLFIQAESHRAFYKIHFIEESTYQFNGRHYFQYLGLLALMLTLGTIIAFLLGVFKFSAAPFAIACILYFLIEKIFDEVLRYDLFAKKFNRWAKLSFLRFSIFILSIAPVLLWKNSNVLILCFGINFFWVFYRFAVNK